MSAPTTCSVVCLPLLCRDCLCIKNSIHSEIVAVAGTMGAKCFYPVFGDEPRNVWHNARENGAISSSSWDFFAIILGYLFRASFCGLRTKNSGFRKVDKPLIVSLIYPWSINLTQAMERCLKHVLTNHSVRPPLMRNHCCPTTFYNIFGHPVLADLACKTFTTNYWLVCKIVIK